MFVFAHQLQQYNIQGTDGELGKVKDIYFDDDWVVRYLVVDTRKWLPGRKVLLSPISFDYIEPESLTVKVFETKDNIKDSPHMDEEIPITRQHEIMINSYYGWPQYWGYSGSVSLWGDYYTPVELREQMPTKEELTTLDEKENHIRSVKDVSGDLFGYHVHAMDEEIGRVTDFIIDDENWKVRYLVVNFNNLLTEKFAVLSTDWVSYFSVDEKKITVDVKKEKIEEGPLFDLTTPLSREDEKKLYESYDQKPYF
ncbi:PRC-barrel domain-containing protein [Evansella sp. AB-P1]|uniref:PRC-barrel domain-containing protein n=1 Tax=Evansella sp. AB-P1 TaxID=3037653 RepID=UPI00241C89CD|nr:PRC-barrel domain-containing protein [Evansella sp. AB-P1]MDG5788436.1 PRC-barrel domain-containing protein [Evansella sp. AB-P1]